MGMTPEEERQVYEIGLKPFLDAQNRLNAEKKRGCAVIIATVLIGGGLLLWPHAQAATQHVQAEAVQTHHS